MVEPAISTQPIQFSPYNQETSTPNPLGINLTNPHTIAVGSGKGGVGKTCVSLLLALYLAHLEYNVVLIDTDFTGPDLHRLAGITPKTEKFLQNFLSDRVAHLKQLQQATSIEYLKCICSKNDINRSHPDENKQYKLIKQLKELDADFVILDLSSKMYETAIELFLRADHQIIVSNSEATSLQQSYNFLKFCFMYELRNSFKSFFEKFDNRIQNKQPNKYNSLFSILQKIKSESPEALQRFYARFKKYNPHLIFNMVHSERVEKPVMALKLASRELLNLEINYVGSLDFMAQIRKALRAKSPLTELNSLVHHSNQIEAIVNKIFKKQTRTQSYHEFRQVINNGSLQHTKIFNDENQKEIICSTQCPYWEKCRFRNGGYACRVKYIGFLHKRAIS